MITSHSFVCRGESELKEREARGRVDLDCCGKDTGQVSRRHRAMGWKSSRKDKRRAEGHVRASLLRL